MKNQKTEFDGGLPKICIPIMRRTFPELITNEIVGVQPMSGFNSKIKSQRSIREKIKRIINNLRGLI